MRKLNNYLSIGVFINGTMMFLKHSVTLPDLVYGMGLGIGIALCLTGMYAINHDISKFHAIKVDFIKKCFNRW